MNLTDKCDLWIKNDWNALFVGSHGIGKASADDALVRVPGGWTAMGSICEGDQIVTPSGDVATVDGVFPQGKQQLYCVKFADGRQTEVTGEHLWLASSYGWRSNYQPNDHRVKTTLELKVRIDKANTTKENHLNVCVGLITPHNIPDVTLPIDPYLLGCLLGDGSLRKKLSFSSIDQSVVNEVVTKLLPHDLTLCHEDTCNYRIQHTPETKHSRTNTLRSLLDDLNLSGCKSETKFIPQIYLESSISQKHELLAGLMDTDGTVEKFNHVSFSSTSHQLALDVQYLIRSLGGRAKISEFNPHCTAPDGSRTPGLLAYRVSIQYVDVKKIFRLSRKLDRLKTSQYEHNGLRIVSIEPSRVDKATCIHIAHNDHLYITDDFIVTHNTAIIESAFERAGLQWQYFSAPTMDPWVDLVGVPKEKTDEETGTTFLDLIRPRAFEEDTVEAIFIDEFNRAPRKTTNAIMELLQFKSINGRKFHNLRFIWAAINPPDEEGTYHVDSMDVATEDRFRIQIELPTEPSLPYFIDKYGEHIGSRAVDWWHNTLPDAARSLVSPRRLDYAVDSFQKGADLADVLKAETRPKTLRRRLEQINRSTSHTERWLEDPDTYINEIVDRNSNIDVATAVAELMEISMDMAISSISQFPAPKLNELALNNKTMVLLLKCYADNPDARRIATAVSRKGITTATCKAQTNKRLKEISTTDIDLFAQCQAVSSAKSATERNSAWEKLKLTITARITTQLLEFDDITMMLILASEHQPGSVADSDAVVHMLTRYVVTEHSNRVVEYVNTKPLRVLSAL